MTGTAEERQKQIEKDLENMAWDDPPEPAYSEFLTDEQVQKFRQRNQEKRGLVIYNAFYDGDNEDELKTRDKNQEYLQRMKASGLSHAEAQQMLIVYYRKPDSEGKIGKEKVAGQNKLKPGYRTRAIALAKSYGLTEDDFWDWRNEMLESQ
jgi:hypothetical protein